MMWTVPDAMALTGQQRRILHSWGLPETARGNSFSARIVLLAGEGKANTLRSARRE